jgi:photosystem II stability/assembly factor-like uncharacterized protein
MIKRYTFILALLLSPVLVFGQWEVIWGPDSNNSIIEGLSFVNDSTGFLGYEGSVNNDEEHFIYKGVLRTRDYGASWDTIYYDVLHCPCYPDSIEILQNIHFINENVGFISTERLNGNHCDIIATFNGGETWERIPTELQTLDKFAFLDEEYGIVYSANGPGLETTDGGLTWNDGGIEFSRDLHPLDDCNAVGTYSGLVRKREECVWSTSTFPTSTETPQRSGREVHAWSQDEYIFLAQGLIGFSNFVSILRTSDGGESYDILDIFTSSGSSDFYFLNDSVGYFSIRTDSPVNPTLFRTEDKGITWYSILTPPVEDGDLLTLSDIQPMSENIMYAVRNNRKSIYRTLNGPGATGDLLTSTLEIEKTESTSSLQIYPNPSSNHFYISSDSNNHGIVEVEILNSLGQLIKTLSWDTNTTQQEVDCSLWNQGVYFIRIGLPQESQVLQFIKH